MEHFTFYLTLDLSKEKVFVNRKWFAFVYGSNNGEFFGVNRNQEKLSLLKTQWLDDTKKEGDLEQLKWQKTCHMLQSCSMWQCNVLFFFKPYCKHYLLLDLGFVCHITMCRHLEHHNCGELGRVCSQMILSLPLAMKRQPGFCTSFHPHQRNVVSPPDRHENRWDFDYSF